LLHNRAMDHTRDATGFTGETLAWFDEGEELAALERDEAAEGLHSRRRVGLAVGVLVALAIAGFAAVLIARHYGLIDLPAELRLPWD